LSILIENSFIFPFSHLSLQIAPIHSVFGNVFLIVKKLFVNSKYLTLVDVNTVLTFVQFGVYGLRKFNFI